MDWSQAWFKMPGLRPFSGVLLNRSSREARAAARVATPEHGLALAPGRLATLMDQQALHCVFQPIADLRSGSIFGHEALIRGPADTEWERPDVLLALAQQEDLLYEFELFCVHTALLQWGEAGELGRLFVNISADALVKAKASARLSSSSRPASFGLRGLPG